MTVELLSERNELVIRRLVLEPGEAMFWHTDSCHRFTVVVRGSTLAIEYRDSGEREAFLVADGSADWDEPDARVHRARNIGSKPYEEVVTFYRDNATIEPQPRYN